MQSRKKGEPEGTRPVNNAELKDLLTLFHGEGVDITRDKYNNITLSKRPKRIEGVYKLGIDEAGRGPLAGPMVYGLVYWKKDPEKKVYNDSKKVKKTKRTEQHYELIQDESVGFIITLLSPLFISINMLCKKKDLIEKAKQHAEKNTNPLPKKKLKTCSKAALETANTEKGIMQFISKEKGKAEDRIKTNAITESAHSPQFVSKHRLNLNELSISCIVQMINACTKSGIDIKEIYIDTVGSKALLAKIIKENTDNWKVLKKIVVEEKADAKYQIVGAASILAKVTRDAFIETGKIWQMLYGKIRHSSVGSGYPSDPITRKWMDASFVSGFGFVPVFRISWKPVLEIINEKAQEHLKKSLSHGGLVCHLQRREDL